MEGSSEKLPTLVNSDLVDRKDFTYPSFFFIMYSSPDIGNRRRQGRYRILSGLGLGQEWGIQ